ncbi:hypothetical protein [Streptomyces cahuitamycinicus]|uniref:hypothetical protein n=1 Tax=Streptomyces cahuitamycinicus TaxID=2070367 RepID=UPI001CA4DAFD|nr:hypothetical protein [Streptomyces cahuitamycinicus]
MWAWATRARRSAPRPCSCTATATERAPISSARQAFRELPAAKAFVAFRYAGHSNYLGDSRTLNTFVDWMRWSLYGDTAAHDLLRSGTTSSTTTWESALS